MLLKQKELPRPPRLFRLSRISRTPRFSRTLCISRIPRFPCTPPGEKILRSKKTPVKGYKKLPLLLFSSNEVSIQRKGYEQYLLPPILQPPFIVFNRKKPNNLFGSKQYSSQSRQLTIPVKGNVKGNQDYLQLFLWEKGIQTIHSTEQYRKDVGNLLLTKKAVKCFTLGFSRPFKKSEDFVIKKSYIYKVDCIKCKLLGVDTKKGKRGFEKKTSFLRKIKKPFCSFKFFSLYKGNEGVSLYKGDKGNAVFFCFSPLQEKT